ncbi:hypothetical protein NDU88_003633 [Pleurodeles waltl]|uniref:Uncharacterized protein n=1 Tax=Pleurodeles waltl TaxID=8319 RepID=A0AAV7VG92_PLEWA|nr:hypothetical protein NDU88_003633 [Pleurodeles waltl]
MQPPFSFAPLCSWASALPPSRKSGSPGLSQAGLCVRRPTSGTVRAPPPLHSDRHAASRRPPSWVRAAPLNCHCAAGRGAGRRLQPTQGGRRGPGSGKEPLMKVDY